MPVKNRHFTVLPDFIIETQITVCVGGHNEMFVTPDERNCSDVLIDQPEGEPSLCPHAIVLWVVLQLAQAQLLHQRRKVDAESAAQALLQTIPAADWIVR